jgi:hypothetical protein
MDASVNFDNLNKFVGTKIVLAQPMTRGEYNAFRGWTIPANENPDDAGYFVEYVDTQPNMEGFAGYVSWTTKEAFDENHVQITNTPTNSSIQYFSYAHLPKQLQGVSKLVSLLAQQMDALLPEGEQKSLGLQKLLEAKDCFVRSSLPPKR